MLIMKSQAHKVRVIAKIMKMKSKSSSTILNKKNFLFLVLKLFEI